MAVEKRDGAEGKERFPDQEEITVVPRKDFFARNSNHHS